MKLALNGTVMEEILVELKKRDIEHYYDVVNEKIVVEGFYKSGQACLTEDEDGQVTAHCRYDETDQIDSFQDLVALNHSWFTQLDVPKAHSSTPWIEAMVEFGYLTKTVRTVTTYK